MIMIVMMRGMGGHGRGRATGHNHHRPEGATGDGSLDDLYKLRSRLEQEIADREAVENTEASPQARAIPYWGIETKELP